MDTPRGPHDISFRLLFASNPLPMWVYDIDTLAFREVNDAAVDHYGYSRDEFLAMRLPDIRPPEDVPRLVQEIEALRGLGNQERPRGSSDNWRHRLKDGRIRSVKLASQPLLFAGQQCVLGVLSDVTELRHAQRALTQYAERLAILHEIDKGVIAADTPLAIAEPAIRRLRELLDVPRAIVSLFDL